MSRAAADLKGDIRAGLAFSGSSFALRTGIDFATSIALGRLLSPSVFGVVAVGAAFLQLSYVVGNLGMAGALIQARVLTVRDRHTAYILSAATGLVLALLGAAGASVAAAFFGMPVIAQVLPLMSVQLLISGLAATPAAILRRDLRLKPLAIMETAAACLNAAVSIGFAIAGHGVWSLVWGPLGSGLALLLALHLATGYVPRLEFDREAARCLLGFGGTLTVKNLLVHLGRHADNLVVARSLGEAATGLYTRAFNLSTLPQERLVSVLYGVCFPAFCRLRDDASRFQAWYLKATRAVAVVVSPLLVGLAVVAHDATLVLLGSAWIGMVRPLQILCAAGLLNSLHMLGGAAIEASGRLRYEVTTQMTYAALVVAGSLVGARYGISGAASGVLAASVTLYGLKALTLHAAIGLSPRRYLLSVVPAVAAAAVMGAVVALVAALTRGSGEPGATLRLVVGIGVGAAVYPPVLRLLASDDFHLVFDQVRDLIRGRLLPAARVPGRYSEA